MIDVTSDDARQAQGSLSEAITRTAKILQSLRGDTATKDMALQPMVAEEDLSTTYDNDHDWFKQHPDRQYRLRPATLEEITDNQRMGLTVPPGAIELTVLRRDPDGTLLALSFPVKHLLAAPSDSEAVARDLFLNIARGRPLGFIDLPSIKARSSTSGGRA